MPVEELGLSFNNVSVDVAEKRILWSVSGAARPGKILALMGPSGAFGFGQVPHCAHSTHIINFVVLLFLQDLERQLFSTAWPVTLRSAQAPSLCMDSE